MSVHIRNDNLWELVESDESDKLDFKSSNLLIDPDAESRRKIARHIAGFANHQGGEIVFGVNDDKEIEGENLIEEECLRTISEIMESRCSPVVQYTYEYFSEDNDDLSEGAVFVLNVTKNEEPPPTAVVNNSNGEIKNREYRIRSGESTRLVPDGELSRLFNEYPKVEFENTIEVAYAHYESLEPFDLSLHPYYLYPMDNLYTQLAEESSIYEELIEEASDEQPKEDELGKFVLFLIYSKGQSW